jgi:hypothetical protein
MLFPFTEIDENGSNSPEAVVTLPDTLPATAIETEPTNIRTNKRNFIGNENTGLAVTKNIKAQSCFFLKKLAVNAASPATTPPIKAVKPITSQLDEVLNRSSAILGARICSFFASM